MNVQTRLIQNVEKVLLGKPDVARLAVACFMAEGHLLIDDIPGVGKTTLALSLAKSIGCDFQRIQFTSDLLPSDVLGVSVFDPKTQMFDFKKGPLFHSLILADEINRASPKTQSALLESMQEGHVSMDHLTMPLPKPFFVVATQNPHEYHGTFPLPESQLDRFMMRLSLGYPAGDVELAILKNDAMESRVNKIEAVSNSEEVQKEIQAVRSIAVDDSLDRYMVALVQSTRDSDLIDLGVSPRGTLALRRASQGVASTFERNYVIPDDVKLVAPYVLTHRIRLRNQAYNGKLASVSEGIIKELLGRIPVPR